MINWQNISIQDLAGFISEELKNICLNSKTPLLSYKNQ